MPTPIPDAALCLSCNYPLRGLESHRCPECGRAFDPEEPLTMNLGRPLDRVAIAALRPIGQWAPLTMWLLASAGTLGPAWLMPSNVLASAWFACWGLFIFACWWRSALRGAVVKYYRQPEVCLRIDDPFREECSP